MVATHAEVEDHPAFAHRAILVDTGRQFLPIPQAPPSTHSRLTYQCQPILLWHPGQSPTVTNLQPCH